jgi:dihydroorotase
VRCVDLLVANGHVIDPANGFDDIGWVAITRDRIDAVGHAGAPSPGSERTFDAHGCYVVPALIDIHTTYLCGRVALRSRPRYTLSRARSGNRC